MYSTASPGSEDFLDYVKTHFEDVCDDVVESTILDQNNQAEEYEELITQLHVVAVYDLSCFCGLETTPFEFSSTKENRFQMNRDRQILHIPRTGPNNDQ